MSSPHVVIYVVIYVVYVNLEKEILSKPVRLTTEYPPTRIKLGWID
jgi:hypothetical protein